MTSKFAHRMFVYSMVYIFLYLNIVWAGKLDSLGALSPAETHALKFAFNLMAILSLAMFGREFTEGLTDVLMSRTGKARAYLFASLGMSVCSALQLYATWSPFSIVGASAIDQILISLAFGLIVGLPFAKGGFYESDVKRIKSVVSL